MNVTGRGLGMKEAWPILRHCSAFALKNSVKLRKSLSGGDK